MLTKEELFEIPIGVGVTYVSSPNSACPYKQNALFMGVVAQEERIIMLTQNGALTRPMLKNYEKTWAIVKINTGKNAVNLSDDELETAIAALYELADEYQDILDNGPDDPFDRVEQRKALLPKMRKLCTKLEAARKIEEESKDARV